MYNLMYRKVDTENIKNMNFHELRFWNRGHELMTKAERDAIKNV